MGVGQVPMESCFKAKLWSEGQTGGGDTIAKAPQEAVVRVDRLRDEEESGKKSKSRWRGGGRPGNARESPALSGEGGGGSTCSQGAQGRQAPRRGPERKRDEQGASSAPPISRASCWRPALQKGRIVRSQAAADCRCPAIPSRPGTEPLAPPGAWK